jgi:glycerol-3-phosphate dehydrogenase
MDAELAVVGAGVVGCATALALARRGASVVLLEAEAEPGRAASGANSGILHTGFDAAPGELETELVLRAAALRKTVMADLGVPVVRCGGLVRAAGAEQKEVIAALSANARRNGVEVLLHDERSLEVPGEAITDPAAYTLALAAAAKRHGAELHVGFRVASVTRGRSGLVFQSEGGRRVHCRLAVNCAGLHADEVARLAGDDSFEIYPRKGEFLVFEPPPGEVLDRILLPVPSRRTKGVLVFPTCDGKVIAGPTAIDQESKHDWSVRDRASAEILPTARAMWPPIDDAEQIAAYAGLRPAGRGVNYLIGSSGGGVCPELVNVAAIRSTGLTASLAIAERVCAIVSAHGVTLSPERPLKPAEIPASPEPWWRRAAGRGQA